MYADTAYWVTIAVVLFICVCFCAYRAAVWLAELNNMIARNNELQRDKEWLEEQVKIYQEIRRYQNPNDNTRQIYNLDEAGYYQALLDRVTLLEQTGTWIPEDLVSFT